MFTVCLWDHLFIIALQQHWHFIISESQWQQTAFNIIWKYFFSILFDTFSSFQAFRLALWLYLCSWPCILWFFFSVGLFIICAAIDRQILIPKMDLQKRNLASSGLKGRARKIQPPNVNEFWLKCRPVLKIQQRKTRSYIISWMQLRNSVTC